MHRLLTLLNVLSARRVPSATCLGITLLLLGGRSAEALLISGSNYVASGLTESLAAVFTTPDGGTSANRYSGFVEVNVSGIGKSYFDYLNDAFHVYYPRSAPASDAGFYQFNFGTTTLQALDVSQAAAHFIVYDIDAGIDVIAPYLPQYRDDHIYKFVLDVGTVESTLHFGVSDGNFSDNAGYYMITLNQLAGNPVPEPSALALLLAGLSAGSLMLDRRSHNRRSA